MKAVRWMVLKKFVVALIVLSFGLQPCASSVYAWQSANSESTPAGEHESAGSARRPTALQACAYDGLPVTIDQKALTGGHSGGGAQLVADIMKYTGLPQNFEVIPLRDVHNAAAMIVLGPDRVPKRIIAYNEEFMGDVRSSTANNNWAPVSIMAHEIGHHLSGHTIQPGESQPATELEADTFSGFVLYKMGAQLADATQAITTLVPPEDRPTHPGRKKRAQAVEEGWRQACRQQSSDCSGERRSNPRSVDQALIATPTPLGSPADAPVKQLRKAQNMEMSRRTQASPVPSTPLVDVLPSPDAKATPVKFDKFVIDEIGILDSATRLAFEQKMYKLAAKHQLEIVTIVTKDLHGMGPDAFAAAMMRQLRVGKLDVGNGSVLVVAPNDKKVGLAMGPGIMLEMREHFELERDRLQSFVDSSIPYCDGSCDADQTSMLFAAAEHIAQNVSAWDFTISFQNLGEMLAKFVVIDRARATGAEIDPEKDPTWRKIVRLEGKLVSRTQAKGTKDPHADIVGPAMQAVSPAGRKLLIYANPQTEKLMTTKLVEGNSYIFIAREVSLSMNPEDNLRFDLLSYDALQR